MSWSVTVTAAEGMPDVQEPIISFSKCPGNMYMCVLEMKERQLREMDRDEAISALCDVIAEVDKGNDGRFSDAYAVDADMKWSEGRETRADFDRIGQHLYKTYERFCGELLRDRIRTTSVRFLLYYKAGYDIKYEW